MKMLFTYKPEGTLPEKHKVWRFTPGKLMNPETEAIEKVTGMPFPQWVDALTEDESTVAVHALLWVLLKREDPTLKYDQVEFSYDEWDLAFDEDEKAQLLVELSAIEAALVEKGGSLPPDSAQLLADLRDELGEAPPADAEAEAEVPKEASPSVSSEDEQPASTWPS